MWWSMNRIGIDVMWPGRQLLLLNYNIRINLNLTPFSGTCARSLGKSRDRNAFADSFRPLRGKTDSSCGDVCISQ